MKYKCLFLTIVCALLLLQCSGPQKIVYNIPATMPENKRRDLLVILDKGKELFRANCSECHGVFTKGKDKVPNFTNTQIENYSVKFMAQDPLNHAVIRKISGEQMSQILNFLRYKRTDTTLVVKHGSKPTPHSIQ